MRIFRGFIIILFIALIQGCSKDNGIEPPPVKENDGRVLLKIDKTNAPQNAATVTAYLTRDGYDTLQAALNLLSDTTADISFQNIPVGTWRLKIDAKDSYGNLSYTGSADVTVAASMITQISLTLQPTSGKEVGGIYILVNWGNVADIWTDYAGNPVCRGINSIFDQSGILKPNIFVEDNLLRMLFTNSGSKGTIGYAESHDGYNWARLVAGPVLSTGQAGAWDSFSISAGPVIKINGFYYMYYSGRSSVNSQTSIGLATSVDCINWTKKSDPVLTAQSGETSSLEAGDVIKINNSYYIYYSSLDYNNNKICLATSKDGISWTKYSGNPILSADKTWEGKSICMPSIITDSSKYILVYGNDISAQPSALGMAISYDGINWSKDNQNPFFNSQKISSQWTNCVWYPCIRKIGTEWRIFYTGYNQRLNYGSVGLLIKKK